MLALAVPEHAARAAAAVASALQLITTGTIDGAMLGVNLAGDAVYSVAEELTRRGVPFIFISGYGDERLKSDFADRPSYQSRSEGWT